MDLTKTEDEEHADNRTIPDKEVILITLNQPLIFLQPIALELQECLGILGNQRSSLKKEVLIKTHQVIERAHISQLREQISFQPIGTLLLQLNVIDIDVAIPITTDFFGVPMDSDSKGANVCSVKITSISGRPLCKGNFEDLFVRFCEDNTA